MNERRTEKRQKRELNTDSQREKTPHSWQTCSQAIFISQSQLHGDQGGDSSEGKEPPSSKPGWPRSEPEKLTSA